MDDEQRRNAMGGAGESGADGNSGSAGGDVYRIPSVERGGWMGLTKKKPVVAEVTPHADEQQDPEGSAGKLNWLRAGVLGANDGIVSVAGTIIGVAGADNNPRSLLIAGVAALAAGAFSMAGGEYVSVSAQRDTEKALLSKERWELKNLPEDELNELSQIYETKGMTAQTAKKAAYEAMQHDALRAHAIDELGINPDELTNPWQAAFSSFVSFLSGGIIPLLFSQIPVPFAIRICLIVFSVALALLITGAVSAQIGGAARRRAVARNVLMGLGTMVFAWLVGMLFGIRG